MRNAINYALSKGWEMKPLHNRTYCKMIYNKNGHNESYRIFTSGRGIDHKPKQFMKLVDKVS